MRKTLSLAAMAAVFAAPAAAANLENPLYVPKSGEFFSKTGLGLMYKKADDSIAHQMNGRAGHSEWPIYRLSEDLGFGVTDRLSIQGGFGWTQDNDIDRAGMHNGRIGLNYRVLDGSETDGIVWDLYSDLHLGGVMKMKGSYSQTGFKYDNYTNGRWGVYAGTKVGKTWDKFTGMLFAELQQTFGNHNNEIDTSAMKALGASGIAGVPASQIQACAANPGLSPMCPALLAGYGMATLADPLSVNLKSTLEYNLGLKAFYEMDEKWSFGAGFAFRHRSDNGIKSVHTTQPNAAAQAIANTLAATMKDMRDGWEEYALSASVSRQLTENVQASLYAEYTFDTSHEMSQNGTDAKTEAGLRINVEF
jgi:hypothetical protein